MKRRRAPAEVVHRTLTADPGHPSTKPQTRGLTEGAILAALAAVIAAAGLLIPAVALVLAPLPIMLLVIRWGMRTGVLATVVAGLILLQFLGPLAAFSAIGFGPIGLALGWGVRRELGAGQTVLAGAAALYASSLASFAVATLVFRQNLLGSFIQAQLKAMQQSAALLERLGAPQQEIASLRLLADAQCAEHHCFVAPMEQLVRSTGPVLLALGTLFWGYLCYTLARSLLRRIGHEIPAAPAILAWRLPRPLAATLVWISGGLSVAGLWFPEIGGAVLSAVFLDLFVFGFLGALVAVTWMNKRQIPRVMQVIVLMMLITSLAFPALLALAIIGMLDTWYDYRRLTQAPPPAAAPDGVEPQPTPDATAPAARSGRGQRVKAAHPQ
jgi:uncharacterized protein YybS (DUF2232 family)